MGMVSALTANEQQFAELKSGPYLLIDDAIIASITNVTRVPVSLKREALSEKPIITAKEHQSFQPFFTVVRDATTKIFRLWYGVPSEDFSAVRSRLAYMESTDGIHWGGPSRILDVGPIQFGASVIDERGSFSVPKERFKLGWYMDGGLKIATSAEGLVWEPLSKGVLVKHNHDINGIFKDTIRNQYVAILSYYLPGESWSGQRRITKQSVSTNLLDWSEPVAILAPDKQDEGETQFYAMDGFLVRGELVIGMVKVLRDDLKADSPPEPPDAYGIGYTSIAWTRDGKQWVRERPGFLDRNPIQGTWDHAHAWIDEQVLVGDEVYLYYAGYKSGHKVKRFEERQIGLIKMKRDRYVGYEAESAKGVLQTKPMRLSGKRLFVNADAGRGELKVEVFGPDGRAIAGFTTKDCTPIISDSVKIEVKWKSSLADLRGQPIALKFAFTNASLFAFEIE